MLNEAVHVVTAETLRCTHSAVHCNILAVSITLVFCTHLFHPFLITPSFFKSFFLYLFVYLFSICRYVWFVDDYLPKHASFVFPRPSAPAYWPAPVRSRFASLLLAIWPRPLTCMGLTSGPSTVEWNHCEDIAHTTLRVLSRRKPSPPEPCVQQKSGKVYCSLEHACSPRVLCVAFIAHTNPLFQSLVRSHGERLE
jgi:hypothetical protein